MRARPLLLRRGEPRSIDPGRERLPVRIALGGELTSAGVEDVAATFRRERMLQQPAGFGVTRIGEFRNRREIPARLFVGPEPRAGLELFEAQRVVAFGVADVAARMTGALGEEDRLDALGEV